VQPCSCLSKSSKDRDVSRGSSIPAAEVMLDFTCRNASRLVQLSIDWQDLWLFFCPAVAAIVYLFMIGQKADYHLSGEFF
jgi:TRAP-type mannitol/chloroaromatic compound transport system permease small subunit